MKRLSMILFFCVAYLISDAQKIESIHFHLYTDSLKKGFFNYINVDGKTADGNWLPLDSTAIKFTSNTGYFRGNDLFIDSSFNGEAVTVTATLIKDPSQKKEIIIYIRKRPFDEPLKNEQQILNEMQKRRS